jgi:hypothetical protein
MHPAHGNGWPPMPPLPSTRPGRIGGAWARVRHQLAIVLALFTAALMFGMLRSPRGWVVVVLAWALLGLLASHRANGRGLRAATEYALVVALVVLVSAALAVPVSPHAKPTARTRPRPPAAQEAPTLEDVRGKVADLWQQVAGGFSRVMPAPKEGR